MYDSGDGKGDEEEEEDIGSSSPVSYGSSPGIFDFSDDDKEEGMDYDGYEHEMSEEDMEYDEHGDEGDADDEDEDY